MMPRILAVLVALWAWLQLPGNPTGVHVNAGSGVFFTGTTRTATTCSQSDVQNKVDASSDLDIVVVPTGTCTWTTPVTISSKSIKLVGNSQSSADAITCGGGGECVGISGASASKFVRLTNFRFVKGVANSDGAVQVSGTIGSVGFRIDQVRIIDSNIGGRGISIIGVYGLVDHYTADVTNGGSIQSIQVVGSDQGNDQGFTPWLSALSLGTINAVVIEDSTFTYTNNTNDTFVDCYSGARMVFRHNTITGHSPGCHGTDSGSIRSPVSIELYENSFTNNSGTNYRAFDHRGGVFMAFNNTYVASPDSWAGFREDHYREDPVDASNTSTWQQCDGNQWALGSTTFSSCAASRAFAPGTNFSCDGNSFTANVKFCSGNRELECTSDTTCSNASAGTCSTYLDGSGTNGYPCRDQPSVGPGQTVFGDYQWNNGSQSFNCGSPAGGDVSNWCQSNRNYFDGKANAQTSSSSPFDGTTGAGWGTTTRRPSTCTTGVFYYDTDASIGYKCTSTDTWTSYYVPYTYPHPYQASRG